MRKFLKIILPPFIGCAGYFLAVRYSGVYFQLQIGDMGGGNLQAFMAYYRYFLPLLFVVAVLTQGLSVVPIWNRTISYQKNISKLLDLVGLIFVCVLFAGGISYMISETHRQFIHLTVFMTAIQMAYWLVDMMILYLLSLKKKTTHVASASENEQS
jgi:NhaP-type Na+/H+ or K+/H+ antiporter